MKQIKTWNDLETLTIAEVEVAPEEEVKALYNRISSVMDGAMYDAFGKERSHLIEKWYWSLGAELDERFRKQTEPSLRQFYEEHIKDKARNEIDADDWSFYSDWHKDCYGYRPHLD